MKDVRAQFGNTAAAYDSSATHASGEDLERLIAVAAPHGGERALDLGCGVGHTLRAASSAARDAFAITPATFAAPKVVIVARRSPISAERR